MLAITTHDFFFFTRREFWFYNGEEIQEGTYNVFPVASEVKERGVHFLYKFTTAVVDLSKTEQELFEGIQPRIRRYIRAAEKQNLEFLVIRHPSPADCNYVIDSFNIFAKKKGILPLTRRWLSAAVKTGKICFTQVEQNGTNIITHVYLFDSNKVIYSHTFNHPSLSNERLRSDANQFLLWKDILFFKEIGISFYDFGGIDVEHLPGISGFKLKFGGEVREYNRYVKTSYFFFLLAKLYKLIF